MGIKTLEWKKGKLYLLDQTKLPEEETYVACSTYQEVAQAIKNMIVRGAPAIGVAAGFGMVLGARHATRKSLDSFSKHLDQVARSLISTRPTAVNLIWAVERMQKFARQRVSEGSHDLEGDLEKEALRIMEEDLQACREMGRQGQVFIPDGASLLTHCNAGALATAGYGTALGVIRAAREAGKRVHVYVDETRPFLQGSRLTAWELMKDRIPCTLITDNMAGWLMYQGKIHLVITGADRIAANGDAANKIGTYSLALLCHAHRIPFYVAAPLSTIDLSTAKGDRIPIEQRSPAEIINILGRRIAPEGVKVLNPAFDVTPHRFISAIITERGIVQKPYRSNLKKVFQRAGTRDDDPTLIG
ncbi:MAG: S-methyl-5-thioribose-1-phosphate isomerase [Syntrophaceae bacterium]|nr:S-methyl-5-thioribose-1-phosphate isomerase [Syntrophaceae bacterium]